MLQGFSSQLRKPAVRPYNCKWNIRNSISPGIPPAPPPPPRFITSNFLGRLYIILVASPMPSYASRFTSCAHRSNQIIITTRLLLAVLTTITTREWEFPYRLDTRPSSRGRDCNYADDRRPSSRPHVREVAPTLVWIGQSIRKRQLPRMCA